MLHVKNWDPLVICCTHTSCQNEILSESLSKFSRKIRDELGTGLGKFPKKIRDGPRQNFRLSLIKDTICGPTVIHTVLHS